MQSYVFLVVIIVIYYRFYNSYAEVITISWTTTGHTIHLIWEDLGRAEAGPFSPEEASSQPPTLEVLLIHHEDPWSPTGQIIQTWISHSITEKWKTANINSQAQNMSRRFINRGKELQPVLWRVWITATKEITGTGSWNIREKREVFILMAVEGIVKAGCH